LTAKAEKSDIRKGMNLGADDYLTKPFNEKELLEAIESRLKKHNFLKKEFSRNIEGLSQFVKEASDYMDLDHLSREYSPHNYKKKDLVFMEGNPANTLYFVQSGTIKTYKTSESGKELVTGIYGSGDFIGQLSLLTDKQVYLESALVLENAELLHIPKNDFATLLHANKEVAYKFVRLISNNLVEVQDQLINIAFATVKQRVAKALLDLDHKGILSNNHDNGICIARDDFAGLIGTATETAIRMLTDFKDEGLITIGSGRKIIIKDKKALEDIMIFN
jgi:CRP-like cAMP-binding protein